MVSGCDRYFQIARCLRDENLRADRQLEHTQIDFEMSFVTEDDVFTVAEGLMKELWLAVRGDELTTPFPRLPYREAMLRYGSDKPDLRFGMEIVDLTDAVRESEFKVFRSVVADGGVVRCLNASGCAGWSRKDIDTKEALAKKWGAKGLAWARIDGGSLTGGISKFLLDCRVRVHDREAGRCGRRRHPPFRGRQAHHGRARSGQPEARACETSWRSSRRTSSPSRG